MAGCHRACEREHVVTKRFAQLCGYNIVKGHATINFAIKVGVHYNFQLEKSSLMKIKMKIHILFCELYFLCLDFC